MIKAFVKIPLFALIFFIITGGMYAQWTEHTIDANFDGAYSVYSADIDGDGDLDVLGAAYTDNDITWWENTVGNGSSWAEHTIDANFNRASSVYSADVDGDGDLDVLGAAYSDNDITWWENTAGDGSSWTEHTIKGNFDGARSVYSADIDGDGDVDVLGAAYNDNDITWWENTAGDGSSWTEHTIKGNFDGARSVYSADVDGDGDVDVLGAAYTDDDITWWENTSGDGSSWTEHTIKGNFDGAHSVYSADVDGDGDFDVLGAAYTDDDIIWWENTAGNGLSWAEHIIKGNFDGARSVYSADVDGDGDLDILGAASIDNDITWWGTNRNSIGLAWSMNDGFDGYRGCKSNTIYFPWATTFEVRYKNSFSGMAPTTAELWIDTDNNSQDDGDSEHYTMEYIGDYNGALYRIQGAFPEIATGMIRYRFNFQYENGSTNLCAVGQPTEWHYCYVSNTGYPGIPGNFYADGNDSNEIRLSWDDVSDELKYILYRNTTTNFAGASRIATLAAGSTEYTDAGLSRNTWYCYWIVASNAKGLGAVADDISTTGNVQNDTSGEWFGYIQDAIDEAGEGDTLIVLSGKYTEPLHIENKTNIALVAYDYTSGGDNTTTVFSNNAINENALTLENSDDISIEGFTWTSHGEFAIVMQNGGGRYGIENNNFTGNRYTAIGMSGVRSVFISNNIFSLNGFAGGYGALAMTAVTNVFIDGNTIRDTGHTVGIDIVTVNGGISNVGVVNNHIYRNYKTGIKIQNTRPGFLLNDVYIANNDIWGNHGSGTGIEVFAQSNDIFGIGIDNNIIKTNGFHGIWTHGTNGYIVYDIGVEGNKIFSNGSGSATSAGMRFAQLYDSFIENNLNYANFGQGVLLSDSSNNNISGNKIFTNTRNGIIQNKTTKDIMYINNIIRKNTLHGMFIDANPSNGPLIISNYIYNQGTNTGLLLLNASNTEVYGNTIHHCGIGIKESNVRFSSIENNSIYSNRSFTGVFLGNTHDNWIYNNRIWGNDRGILNANSYRNVIESNTVFHCTNGISFINRAYSNSAINNIIYSNKRDAVSIHDPDSDGNLIYNNTIYGRNMQGILISAADYNNIENNKIMDCISNGVIIIADAQTNLISRNMILNSGSFGVFITDDPGKDNIIQSNRIITSAQSGIRINKGDRNFIYRNIIDGSGINGITIAGVNAVGNDIINNTILKNNGDAVHINNGSSGCEVINNIAWSNIGCGFRAINGVNQILRYNLSFNNTGGNWIGWLNINTNSNIIANPILNSTTYQLLPGSPCIDSGTNIAGLNNDWWLGLKTDRGALESPFSLSGQPVHNVTQDIWYMNLQPAVDAAANGDLIRVYQIILNEYIHISNFRDLTIEGVDYCMNGNYTALLKSPTMDSGTGIMITNSTNVIIYGLAIRNYRDGITLTGRSINNEIFGNTIYSNDRYGVRINSGLADNNIIMSNHIWGTNQDRGIYIYAADNIIIRDNSIHNHNQYGLYCNNSVTHCGITNNKIYSNDIYGICITNEGADNNTIVSNHIWGKNQNSGVYIYRADYQIIRDNIIYNNQIFGIELRTSATHCGMTNNQIYSNSVGGVRINSGTANNNTVVSNHIWGTNQDYGMRISYADNIIIRNNSIHNNEYYGIQLDFTAMHCGMTNNQIYSNDNYGIYINSETADNNSIVSNNIWGKNQDSGIVITNADNIIIRDNSIYNNATNGIYFAGTATYCGMTNNQIYSNDNDGIYINSETADNNSIVSNNIWGVNQNSGIYIYDADYQIIRDNSIHNNQQYGLYFRNTATHCGITNNQIYSNDTAGIYIYSETADNNSIVSNHIWGKNQNSGVYINAADDTIIRDNTINNNQINGLYFFGSVTQCGITNNQIYSNNTSGIRIYDEAADNNSIVSNNIWGENQNNGIYINDADILFIARNRIHDNAVNALSVNGSATGIRVIHNTMAWNGLNAVVAYGGQVSITNNLFVANNCSPMSNASGATMRADYNMTYNNGCGSYSGFTHGSNLWSGDPLLDSTTFHLTGPSKAVDNGINRGDPYNNAAPDFGWWESPFDSQTNVRNVTQNKWYDHIQPAVNDANTGDEIRVYTGPDGAGVFNEQVRIVNATNLTIIGDEYANNGTYAAILESPTVNSSNGITIINSTNVMIHGLAIRKYRDGIYIDGNSINNEIFGNTVYSNDIYGIRILSDDADNNSIISNHIWGKNQNSGVYIRNADNTIIRDNTINNNQINGLYFFGSVTQCGMTNNQIYSNNTSGIRIYDEAADNNSIVSNYIWGANQNYGIYINNADYQIIRDNSIYNNQQYGLYFFGSATQCGMTNNQIYSNEQYGVFINSDGADNNRIISNTIWGANQNSGIFITNADYLIIRDNSIYNHATNAIYLTGSATYCGMTNNDIYSNSLNGICINSEEADNNTIVNNDIFGYDQLNDSGIYIAYGDYTTISNNALYNNCYGVNYRNSATYNTIKNSYFSNNRYGIYNGTSCSHNSASNNIIRAGLYGIYHNTGTAPIYYNNEIRGVTSEGIRLFGGAGAIIERNYIVGNGGHGLQTGVNNVNLYLNTIVSNNNGVYMSGGSFTRFTKNNIYSNTTINFTNRSTSHVMATNNWWGTTIVSDMKVKNISWTNQRPYRLFGPFDISTGGDTAYIDVVVISNAITNNTTNVILTFTDFTTRLGFSAYNIYRTVLTNTNSYTNMTYADYCIASNVTRHVWTNTGLTSGQSYAYYVTVKDRASQTNESWYSEKACTTIAAFSTNVRNVTQNKWYGHIQAAVDDANNGDYIRVYTGPDGSGVFNENVVINNFNKLTIVGNDYTNNGTYAAILEPATANSGNGIAMTNSVNVMIHGLEIRHYYTGVLLNGASVTNEFLGNTIYSNNTYGIRINSDTADNNSIVSNNIWGLNQDYGIYINHGDNQIIRDNTIHNNFSYGLYFTGTAMYCGMTNNQIYSNESYGIYINSDTADNNSIVSNTIFGTNQNSGVYISAADNTIIRDNTVYNNSQYGLYFTGTATQCGMTNNQIYSNESYGIYINYDTADNNSIVSNNIWGTNQDSGVYISAADNTIIRDNTIYNNSQYGLYFTGSATQCGMTNNQIYSNATAGVFINSDDADNNSIVSNHIWGTNQDRGIVINNADYQIIRDNTIHNNSQYGLSCIGSATQCGISNNQIYSNESYGIYINSDTADNNTIVSNNIWGLNQDYGIYINNGDNQIIRDNTIHNNFFYGLCFAGTAMYCGMTNNKIYSNDNYGIYISSDTADNNSIVSNNIWGANQDRGIVINNADYQIIRDNSIYHQQDGIYLSGTATQCGMTNNQIYSNSSYGISISSDDADNNSIVSNTIYGGGQVSGIVITNADYTLIKENNVFSNTKTGIVVFGSVVSNRIIGNTVFENGSSSAGQGIDLGTDLDDAHGNTVIGNTVYDNNNSGVMLHGVDRTYIYSNTIYSMNTDHGIHLSGTACLNEINNNNIYSNAGNGVYFDSMGCLSNAVLSNSIYNNVNNGVQINDSDNTRIYRNRIARNSFRGIYFTGNAIGAVILHNTIYSNQDSAVTVTNNGNVFVTNNILSDNQQYGLNQSAGTLTADYNLLWNNSAGAWNGTITGNSHVWTNNSPMLNTTSFTLYSSASGAVDRGTNTSVSAPSSGLAPDLGWWESPWTGDLISPYLTNCNPTNNEINVMTNAVIYFEINDDAGVLSNSIVIYISNQRAFSNGVFLTGFNGTIVSNSTGTGYIISVDRDAYYTWEAVITNTVKAEDGVNLLTTNYAFTIHDVPIYNLGVNKTNIDFSTITYGSTNTNSVIITNKGNIGCQVIATMTVFSNSPTRKWSYGNTPGLNQCQVQYRTSTSGSWVTIADPTSDFVITSDLDENDTVIFYYRLLTPTGGWCSDMQADFNPRSEPK